MPEKPPICREPVWRHALYCGRGAPTLRARGGYHAMDTKLTSRLRLISLFEDLGEAELQRIARSCVTRSYERTTQVYGEHDEATDVFFILEGTVRINSTSAEGREIIFNDLGVGHMFGEFAAIDGQPRSATVVALSDCVLASMPAAR